MMSTRDYRDDTNDGLWAAGVLVVAIAVVIGVLVLHGCETLPEWARRGVSDPLQALLAIFCFGVGLGLSVRSYLSQRAPLWTTVLRVYVFAAIAFGGLHYGLYLCVPTSYSFSTNVASTGQVQEMLRLQQDSRQECRRLEMLARLRLWVLSLDAGEADKLVSRRGSPGADWVLPDKTTVKHLSWVESRMLPPQPPPTPYGMPLSGGEGYPGSMGQPVSVQCWRLEIADERGTEAWGDHMGGARDSFVGIVETLVTDRHLTGTKYAAQLAQLERVEEDMGVGISRQLRGLDAVHPFSLLDFLYFSFITVSTVGYGDIVPNSTSVRMVVVAQIVLGIWLIVRAGQGGRGRAEDD